MSDSAFTFPDNTSKRFIQRKQGKSIIRHFRESPKAGTYSSFNSSNIFFKRKCDFSSAPDMM